MDAMAITSPARLLWIQRHEPKLFGDARGFGTQLAANASDVVSIAASPRSGYWVAARDGTVGTSTTAVVSPTSGSTRARAIAFELVRRMNAERAARHLPALSWDPLLGGYANSWAHALLTWGERRAAIKALRKLDDRELRDIGLHRDQIEAAVYCFTRAEAELGRFG